MLRRIFTLAAAGSMGVALLAGGIVARSWFASDVYKAFTWDGVARHYSELHVVSQGGLLMIHHTATTAAPGDDPSVARDRAGPTGRRVRHYTQRADVHSAGPWVWFDSYRATTETGVATPHGLSENWTFECRPFVVGLAALLLPAALVGVRVFAARRRQRTIAAGGCAACGYDLRASPDRCPECGTAVTTPAGVPA